MQAKTVAEWFGAGLVSVPVTALLHELGHYAAAELLGWSDIAFHYSSVTLISGGPIVATPIHAAWKVAIIEIAGPAVSLAIIYIAASLSYRSSLHIAGAALSLAAAVRFVFPLATGGILLLRAMARNRAAFHPNLDEFYFAENWGIPPFLVLLSSVLAAGFGVFFMIRSLWDRELISRFVSVVLGIAAGFAIYSGFLGPRLLP